MALYFTQKLALRRNLHVPQSLTSVHDQSNAWFGLASAFMTFCKQFIGNKTSSQRDYWRVASVFGILVYLSGLSVLSITLPLVVSIGYLEDGSNAFVNITSLLPFAGTNASAYVEHAHLVVDLPYPIHRLRGDFAIVSIVPLLSRNIYAFGLYNNSIFDIPNFDTESQPIAVNTVRIVTACKIPTLSEPSNIQFNHSKGTYSFQIDERIEPISVALSTYISSRKILSLYLSLCYSSPLSQYCPIEDEGPSTTFSADNDCYVWSTSPCEGCRKQNVSLDSKRDVSPMRRSSSVW